MNALTIINPNTTAEYGRADFLAADVATRRDRKAAERSEVQRNLEAAEREFAEFAADRYENGHAEAESDSADLQDIAAEIADFVQTIEAKFDALLIARDAGDDRVKRTTFSLSRLTQVIARELGEELLGDEAALVLRRAADLKVL